MIDKSQIKESVVHYFKAGGALQQTMVRFARITVMHCNQGAVKREGMVMRGSNQQETFGAGTVWTFLKK